ncbi:hypothetical protein QE375_003200 [Microbacterium foliorum]|uniref:Uncharacterized protein n=1 Tax=Microbacterium foliorum TaxID=104336 RepID=A0ABU1HUB6_9MICO|nr:hypothetical protein [Microbacterium foliorum]MDR6143646.1 hypothetical protein [Microbacterium foliorum]
MGDADLSEIEIVSDGDGISLIGSSSSIEIFLASNRLESRELDLPRLSTIFGGGAAVTKAGSEVAANSGRWMKLTEESWAAVQKLPKTAQVTNSSSGHLHATLRAPTGQFAKNLQFLRTTPASVLTNPAMLAGVAGIMAQVAMQQTMDEITDYLAIIDEKVDDVLRAQKDAVIADMIGVDMMLEEAMTIRKGVGGVSEVTWSKVQGSSMTIARTQAYALRQIDALAEKLESKSVSDLTDASKKADRQVQDWLAVLAHCFYLQEAMGMIELDRVFKSSPEELDQHRVALRTARANRADLIARTTRQLLDRMDGAASIANSKVLLNPIESPTIVRSRNKVAGAVGDFHARLGIEAASESLESRRWASAVADTRDGLLRAGGDGVGAARRIGAEGVGAAARAGTEGVDKAKEIAGSLAGLAGRSFRRRGSKDEPQE